MNEKWKRTCRQHPLSHLPEKRLWTSLRGRSSCWLRWSGTSCQSWSPCISQIGCCYHSWWSLHFLLPDTRASPLNLCTEPQRDFNGLRQMGANNFNMVTVLKHCQCSGKNRTSVIGLDARTLSSTRVLLPDLLTTAKYLIAYRADTVLPAPDSPLTIIDWFLWFLSKKKVWIDCCYYFMWLFEVLFTLPSVCKPLLPLQIYEGPCLPCSGLSRHEWLHLHR